MYNHARKQIISKEAADPCRENACIMRIIELNRDEFKEQKALYSYDSYGCWKTELIEKDGAPGMVFRFEKGPRVHREYELDIFQYPRSSFVYALYEENEMRGYIELIHERSGRLRIAGLCVFDGFRRRGYGSLLMTKAKEIARRLHCRGLVL